jgi:hypothetical protein
MGDGGVRKFAFVAIAALLVTACGTTVSGRAEPVRTNSVTDLSYPVSSQTANIQAPRADQVAALPAP